MEVFKMLDGYKTYFFGFCGIIFAIANATYKWFPQELGIQVLVASFGMIGIKSAIKKLE